ncbi:penicillin-binding protein activator LpoB [Sulfurospirillum barnesii]|uniref:Collagen-binding surface adhesin SpaP (Antigen I/II family) n=1 Tax=Sulfurospirillum barnesii (strain ATCC 700032 / DSM 10660 / SES-3) TaxID=760154 RepID=I3XUK1_SULBS|nr:penicillin-binding protein activator LpoB [Sulfurospirillum barnesii]AFL67625.1 collagen-binding surface adhesin SpaP (antigen I/II family) [Sulfurospirillum barnesii SES-3]
MGSMSKIIGSVAVATFLFTGCATTGGAGRVDGDSNVAYGDAKAVETVTADFGSTDLQATAEMMTQSLLESRYIMKAQQPPKIRLRDVKNQTYEHIDTKAITDKIRIKLLKSGSVRFLADKSNLSQVNDERDLTETATKKKTLKAMTDSDYIVTGTVRSIKKANANVQDVYYNISLELVDPQSGEILWADEKEIRKVSKKSSLGW